MHPENSTTEVTTSLIGNTLTTITTTTLPLTMAEAPSCLADYTTITKLVEYATTVAVSSPPFVLVIVKSATVDVADTKVTSTIPTRKVKRLTMAMKAELCDKFSWPLFEEVSSKRPATIEELDTLVAAFKEQYILPYQAKESNKLVNTFIDQFINRAVGEFRRSILRAQKEVLRHAQEEVRLAEKRKRLARKKRRLAYLKAKALANPRKVTDKNPVLRKKLQYELETLEKNISALGNLLQDGIGNEDRHYAKISKYMAEVKVIKYRLS